MPNETGRGVLIAATKAANRFSHPTHIACIIDDDPGLTDTLDVAMRKLCKTMDSPLRPVGSEEVVEMVLLGAQTIRKYQMDGRFPKPTKLSNRSIWPYIQIVAFQMALGLIAHDDLGAA